MKIIIKRQLAPPAFITHRTYWWPAVVVKDVSQAVLPLSIGLLCNVQQNGVHHKGN